MKNNFSIGFLAAVFLLVSVTIASAFPILTNDYNGVFFRNSEVVIDNGNDIADIGDIFWGVMSVNEIVAPTTEAGQTGPQLWGSFNPDGNEYTGYFATIVVDKFDIEIEVGGVTDTFSALFFAPAPVDPNGILDTANGEAIRIYRDSTPNYNDFNQGSALATATDGVLEFSLGFADMSNYWYTPLITDDFFEFSDVGESYAGLDYIIDPSWGYLDVNDPNEDIFDTDVDFWFNSEIFTLGSNGVTNYALFNDTPSLDNPMFYGSNDPGVHNPIPEPSTFLLLACGLIGLVALGRKKFKV